MILCTVEMHFLEEHTTQGSSGAAGAGRQQVRDLTRLPGELPEQPRVLRRGTARRREQDVCGPYLGAFPTSDVSSKFSTRQGLNSLLSLARMKKQRFVSRILQRAAGRARLEQGKEGQMVSPTPHKGHNSSKWARNPQLLSTLKQAPSTGSVSRRTCLTS